MGFPGGSEVKASACNAGDPGSIPGLGRSLWLSSKDSACSPGDVGDAVAILGSGRSPTKGNSNPLQYSCLGNPMDRGACGRQSVESQRIGHDWTHTHIVLSEQDQALLIFECYGHDWMTNTYDIKSVHLILPVKGIREKRKQRYIFFVWITSYSCITGWKTFFSLS